MGRGTGGFSEATVLVAGHEIRVHEVSPKHVRVIMIGPRAQGAREVTVPVLDLRLRHGQWHGKWEGSGQPAGPFDSIKTVVAAISEALAE